MTVEAAQKKMLRIIEELENRICSDAPRPGRKKCVRLIDATVVVIENVAKACPDSGVLSAVHDQSI